MIAFVHETRSWSFLWNRNFVICSGHDYWALWLRLEKPAIWVYIYTYKRVVCVCWFVGLLFIGHTTFVHFAALPPSGREQPSRRGPGGPARAGKRMHSESTRACRTTSQRKNRTLMPFKNKTVRARACCRITVCLLLECLLFESYWIVLDLWSEPTLVSSSIPIKE